MQQFIVSHGGVIRALNKEAGPSRLTKVNIGYEALEEIDPTLESHSRNEYRKLNELTGIEYVPVVNWVIRKVSSLGHIA